MKEYLWLIPFLPVCGAFVNLMVGRFLGKKLVSLIGCGTVLASFTLVLLTFFELLKLPAESRVIHQIAYTWLEVGTFKANAAFLVDPLSIIMLLVVTGVGFLIHVYSVGYMADDKRYARYFGYLNLFIFAMLLLVAGDNLLMMFIGWEGVGLCSYLLIGFWFEKTANAVAGMKAFIVNRIGDFGFVIGVFLIFWSLGTVDFAELKQHANVLSTGLATAIALLLFVGAAGKSAQIPLYVWLPDAMAGPTPVSALIHAATMVTAGVYMIARMHFIYLMAPTAMMIVAGIGVATALYAGTIGLVQNDIKKVLAYSTISQLGYMFLGVGVGAFVAGIFHLMTHAFFKALLFMGSGSVIHGTGGEQDIRKMGGLRKYMPVTFITFFIGCLAIAGIPGLSGFFSKDEILWKSFSTPGHGHWILWIVGVLGAGITAFYMFRLLFKTFFGKNYSELTHKPPEQEPSGNPVCCDTPDDKHSSHGGHSSHGSAHHGPAHESPWVMTVPLIILAVFSIVGGYVGIPAILGGANHIEHFMEPVFATHPAGHATEAAEPVSGEHHSAPAAEHKTDASHSESHGTELLLMIISIAVALSGIGLAYYIYILNPALADRLAARFKFLHNLLLNKYYIDELYQAVVIKPLLKLNTFLAQKIDLGIIDWLVNASAKGTERTSAASGWADNTFVDGAVNAVGTTTLFAGAAVRQAQTGRLKSYLAWALTGMILLVLIFYLILK